ncbi:hypothetical protein PBV87_07430 [Niameybacter massiliensis]|uniref:Uncharacterized protein n=1 Tax=Holtiella tumoricola TaxID=3018743 RepID=A0AA42DLG2_9FIRM|nr:hypothetical protein [Holtiella tumoricola]MDA3731310.1 hypothetical protein [Holtiella tumoricola]
MMNCEKIIKKYSRTVSRRCLEIGLKAKLRDWCPEGVLKRKMEEEVQVCCIKIEHASKQIESDLLARRIALEEKQNRLVACKTYTQKQWIMRLRDKQVIESIVTEIKLIDSVKINVKELS